MGNKINVINKKGQLIRMSENALLIAERHFGVSRNRPGTREVPQEILNLEKIKITKAAVVIPAAEIVNKPVVKEETKIIIPEVKAETKTVIEPEIKQEAKAPVNFDKPKRQSKKK